VVLHLSGKGPTCALTGAAARAGSKPGNVQVQRGQGRVTGHEPLVCFAINQASL
jgi:hypothetical protein